MLLPSDCPQASAMVHLSRATPRSAALPSLLSQNHAFIATAKTRYRMNHRVRINVVRAENTYLRMSKEERDRFQRMQVIDRIDRAAAAFAAARSLAEDPASRMARDSRKKTGGTPEILQRGSWPKCVYGSLRRLPQCFTPGPDFWVWAPPKISDEDDPPGNVGGLPTAGQSMVSPTSTNPVLHKDHPAEYPSIPLESKLKDTSLPPFRSVIEINPVDKPEHTEAPPSEELGIDAYYAYAAALYKAYRKTKKVIPRGVNDPPGNVDEDDPSGNVDGLTTAGLSMVSPTSTNPVLEKDHPAECPSILLESKLKDTSLAPFRSAIEMNPVDKPEHTEAPPLEELGSDAFYAYAAALYKAYKKTKKVISHGVNADGSNWWKETGIELLWGTVCARWTVTRGVSADKTTEWEEKYWEASNDSGYKELGSEKSGRDAYGNVWREYQRESMLQEDGILNLEKAADKWNKNEKDEEWQEQWWESYDNTGQSHKWGQKWCSIDPYTPLEADHVHIWHERWGEKYDGLGGSTKYTEKWAERFEGDGWSKWGDKWDEDFDTSAHGVKQGETWRQGKQGEIWNRTWGEQHNGSGWVHIYGKSSCGEHWDTHVEQETWYERFPHYGFHQCFENSAQLLKVKKPSKWRTKYAALFADQGS